MSNPVNEMAINLPMVSVTPVAPAPAGYSDLDVAPQADSAITIGSPSTSRHPSCISVYAESISMAGAYDPDSESCMFDVVFNVGIREGETSKTYRVVKRISLDKVKLACDAECSAPISVVEHAEEAKKAQAAQTAKRFRILAGLE
jgi:hypothetical protein